MSGGRRPRPVVSIPCNGFRVEFTVTERDNPEAYALVAALAFGMKSAGLARREWELPRWAAEAADGPLGAGVLRAFGEVIGDGR